MNEQGPSLEQIKAGMRAGWMAGDFGVIAKMMTREGEAFVERLGFAPGEHVLDIACGTGNVAIALARNGVKVTGVDIATNLLEQGRERAAAAKVTVSFDEGDAEQLAYADGSFEGATSMYGAIFAPRPDVVASECARVIKPGGRLGMANWNADSFSGLMFAVGAKHAPPPPGLSAPVLWGDEKIVRERLEPYFDTIETKLIQMTFDLPTNPAGAVTFFRTFFGPTQVAFARLDEAGQAAFAADLEQLWESRNVAPDPQNHTLIHNEYLQVTAIRR